MTSRLDQISALIWKNSLLCMRNWKSTFIHVMVAGFFVVFLAVLGSLPSTTELDQDVATREASEFVPVGAIPACTVGEGQDICYTFVYNTGNPYDAQVSQLVDYVINRDGIASDSVLGIDGGLEEVDEWLLANPNISQAAYVFDLSGNASFFNMTYVVKANNTYPNCRESDWWKCPSTSRSLYMPMATAMDEALLVLRSGGTASVSVSYTGFPHPVLPNYSVAAGLPGSLLLALTVPMTFIIPQIVREKETRLRFALGLIGVKFSSYWISWAVIHLGLALLSSLMLCAIGAACQFNFFLLNSFGLYFFTFLFYQWALVTTSYFITAFTNSVKFSRLLATAYLILFGLFSGFAGLVYGDDADVSNDWRYLLSFFPPLVTYKALADLGAGTATNSGIDEGLSWSERSTNTVRFPIETCWGWLWIDIVFYAVLAWYFDNIVPDVNGVAKPLWFPFTREYWGMKSQADRGAEREQADDEEDTDVAKERKDIAKGKTDASVVLHDVKKTFLFPIPYPSRPPAFQAVQGVSFRVAKDTLLCLLGPNGAGKTTVINTLIGGLSMSEGYATILGHDVETEMQDIRSHLGVCPQFDILWDELTGAENLWMFAKLKGLSSAASTEEAERRLEEVDLTADGDLAAVTYSGGMRRRLSVAMALTCDPDVVFLDEPTTGMDPVSRRKVWEIIQRAKKNRAVILTTHSMEEAEVLGDKIAIMAKGRLRCLGTTTHLKQKFGKGYRVVVIAEPDELENLKESLLDEFSGSLSLLSSSTVSFSLQVEGEKGVKVLPELFEKLQKDDTIKDFQISLTTLEDVFLKIAEENLDNPVSDEEEEDAGWGENRERSTSNPRGNQDSAVERRPPGFVQQAKAVAYKTARLQRTKKFANCCQIVIPSFIVIGLVLLQVLVVKDATTVETEGVANPETFPIFGLSPTDTFVLAGPGAALFAASGAVPTKIVDTEEDLQRELYDNWFTSANYSAGLFVSELDVPSKTLAYRVYYNRTRFGSEEFELFGTVGLINGLFRQAAAFPQQAITALASAFPTVSKTEKFDLITILGAIFFPLIFFIQFPIFVSNIMYDKENRLLEIMKMMGMSMSVYWVVNFVFNLVMYLVMMALVMILGYIFGFSFFLKNNFFILLLLFVLWGWAMIGMAFVLTSFFAKDKSASIFSSMMVGLFWSLTPVFLDLLSDSSTGTFFLSLIPFVAFYRGVQEISTYTVDFDGMSFSDLSSEDVSLDNIYGYLIVEGVVLYFLAWYLDNIFPVGYGVKKSPFFCLQPSYWKGTDVDAVERAADVEMAPTAGNDVVTDEDVLKEREMALDAKQSKDWAIRLVNLRKVFGLKTAVRDQSFGVRKGEVFGLLGHNGAGKTTTASLLSGLIRPTAGDAYIQGLSIRTQMDRIHTILGVCPQHDLLWWDLTPREHLRFYGRLRGLNGQELAQAVDDTIADLNLTYVKDKKAGKFSGGMKRRLSIGIAIIGNPKVIFLDEPTTGLDPKNRRDIWNVVSNVCKGDTAVVLTTHSMEEAEALCSRIGIMSAGSLRCVGTSAHLKSKFASGYAVLINIEQEKVSDASIKKVAKLVKKLAPGAEEQDHSLGPARHFHIDEEGLDLANFFEKMEESKEKYDIADWVIAQSTLEDVFIKISNLDHGDNDNGKGAVAVASSGGSDSSDYGHSYSSLGTSPDPSATAPEPYTSSYPFSYYSS